MKFRIAVSGGLLALAVSITSIPARAEVVVFRATLDGRHGAEATGSTATGTARIEVDTAAQQVSVDLLVDGITVDGLWDKLVAAPVGPIHFHKYAAAAGGDTVLVLPVPYGPHYSPTAKGLRVKMERFGYAKGAGLLNSSLPFDEFVTALRSGLVMLNVHTDAFNPGEISGHVLEDRGRRAGRPTSPSGG